jgi:hypothetical protein
MPPFMYRKPPVRDDRARLIEFAVTVGGSARSVRRDASGYFVKGRNGRAYATPDGFEFLVATPLRPDLWAAVKERLSFCQLQRDGSDEGVLRLARTPFRTEAAIIRSSLGIRSAKRRQKPITADCWVPGMGVLARFRIATGPPIKSALHFSVTWPFQCRATESCVSPNSSPTFC